MAIVVNKKKVVELAPPAPKQEVAPVVVHGVPAEDVTRALQAQQQSLQQVVDSNAAFITALKHEFAKQNYKSITATVERDKVGKISKIHMEVERA